MNAMRGHFGAYGGGKEGDAGAAEEEEQSRAGLSLAGARAEQSSRAPRAVPLPLALDLLSFTSTTTAYQKTHIFRGNRYCSYLKPKIKPKITSSST